MYINLILLIILASLSVLALLFLFILFWSFRNSCQCPYCGCPVYYEDKYCRNCARKLIEEENDDE